MSTSNRTVDEKYNEAIQSLKKINSLLFYDELKTLLKDREQTIAELNGEVFESVENLRQSLSQFPLNISEQLKEDIIAPQSELFDSKIHHFNETLTLLEKKIAMWHQQYQEYLSKTEQLLEDLKERQRNDYKFMEMQTEKVLEAIRSSQEQIGVLFTQGITDQASITNIKYEAMSERLSDLSKNLHHVEASLMAEVEQLNLKQLQDQRDFQELWEEKWKLNADATAKKEQLFKKWLIGLAVGQGVSILLVLVVLFFK
ncbi:hypothetical protein [Neobacillus citreus]|uniref:Uncharacterized protein n=1 Tax=Neobacillus citreus TaxID=2833578 RepID=A0A942YCL4_9BACI|nr:hypothetical protein [Neobacillus citreus]MCH6264415.1 hypothetical protein [Neobacillus citreus]